MNSLRLLALLPAAPQEFFDRVVTILSARWESVRSSPPHYDHIVDAAQALRDVAHLLPQDCGGQFTETAYSVIEDRIRAGQANLPSDAPFRTFHNGGRYIARLCYTIARMIRPKVVVECGVCYGVTSAYFLQALDLNAQGHLHSIDLPPLGRHSEAYVGSLVPKQLRHRWTLHRGPSRRLLRPLLTSLQQIDVFLHDSLHTYENMNLEFAMAWPALRPGGVLISDDVEGNTAFQELTRREDVAQALVFREEDKPSLVGMALKKL